MPVYGIVQTAGKSVLFLNCDLEDKLSALLFASDQIEFVCPDITSLSAWVAVVTRVATARSQ